MSLDVRLLGAPSVTLDDVSLTITTRKAVALLAYLAVTGVAHTRDALATLFWPEADSEHARGALRYTLAQLRTELGDAWLATSRDAIGLQARDDLVVDVRVVEAMYAQVAAHGHALREPCPVCAPLLRDAVAQQRGPLLAGFSLSDSPAFDDWLLFEAERLQRAQASAFGALIGLYRDSGTPEDAIAYAQRWLTLDSLDDDANRVLLELLIASGQRAAAQRHYAAYATLLRVELDSEPDAAATAMIAQLSTGAPTPAPPRLAGAPAPADAEPVPTLELPRAAGRLVGRAHELAALGRLLDDPSCRLLTLSGPGGSGKTRLALALADARRGRYRDGIGWVALAGVDEPGGVAATIAAAVGCPRASGDDPQERLLEYLRARQLLLILDNVEHLQRPSERASTDVITLVERMLATAPAVQLVVTSRVRLKLHVEQLYPVQGLPFPEWDAAPDPLKFPAVELFVARARRVEPHFALTATTTPAVATIVRLLAGQPLAIELAAGWIGVLQPSEIAGELGRGIDLLATEMRDVPERHRSMRASYALSWQLLNGEVQTVQQALSVFHGGFTREAADHVAAATPRILRTLLDHSLLAISGRADGTRYAAHELLRQFAAEQLAHAPEQQAAIRARHARYYLDWIVEQTRQVTHVQTTLVWVEVENVRVAWLWAAEQPDIALLGHAIDAVCSLFQRQGRSAEGMALCDALLERLDPEDGAATAGLLGQALAWKAAFAIACGQLDVARSLLEQSLPLLGDAHTSAVAFAQRIRGQVEQVSGDLPNATAWLERALHGYRDGGDQRGMAWTLDALGRTARLAGDYPLAQRHATASLTIYRGLNDRLGTAHALAELGLATAFGGDRSVGVALLEESRRVSDAAGDQIESLRAQRHLAATVYQLGSFADARPLLEACIARDEHVGNRLFAAEDRLYLATIQLIECQYDAVTHTAEALLAGSRALGHTRNVGFAQVLLGLAELGRGAYLAARHQLEASLVAMEASHLADDPVMAEWGLCQVARALGEQRRARRHARATLALAADGRGARAACLALNAFVGILADEGQVERAIELEAVVLKQPLVQLAGFFHGFMVDALRTRREHLLAEVAEAARERGQARELLATLSELLVTEHVPTRTSLRRTRRPRRDDRRR